MIRSAKVFASVVAIGCACFAQGQQPPAGTANAPDKASAYYNFAMGRLYEELADSQANVLFENTSMNPHTGQPAVGLASLTVVGARLAATDAYATAAFAMGPAARDWVESLDGYEAFAVTPGGQVWQTSGCRAHLASA